MPLYPSKVLQARECALTPYSFVVFSLDSHLSPLRNLGVRHLVIRSETYKTKFGIVTQTMGRLNEVPIKVGSVQCTMTFMVVNIDNYDILLGLDFLIKIGVVVDVGQGLIQVRHDPVANVELLPLTMVNML